MPAKINVTIWNEFLHEKKDEKVRHIYPDGMHNFIANFLSLNQDINVRTGTLDQPEHGLTGRGFQIHKPLLISISMPKNPRSRSTPKRTKRRAEKRGQKKRPLFGLKPKGK